MDKIILEAQGITKRFPGVLALDKVDLRIYAGAVQALVGENGAGKSTLMNILSGVYTDYEGSLLMDGRPCRFSSALEARGAGIAIIHQELNLVPYMSVAENIFLGREAVTRSGLIDYRSMKRQASRLLSQLHFDIDPDTRVADLRVGQQQLVEIAKALSLQARVLIMDEPTSSLSEKEVQTLFEIIDRLKAQGTGIVYITHKMDEISRLADYVTVLRDGCLIGELPAAQLDTDDIVRMMVGRERSHFFVKQPHQKQAVRLQVDHLSLKDAAHPGKYVLRDICFSVSAGEVLGIYGLMGAGRTELLETIFGLHPQQADYTMSVDGRAVRPRHPQEALDSGIALIPEDRKRDGLVLDLDITENMTLASLGRFLQHGLLQHSRENRTVDDYRERLAIKSYSRTQLCGQLSGGNQQKVVIARSLLTGPKVLLLDEPTRGIDIQAKNEIYQLIDRWAGQGMAIVLISSELPEIMAVSDRILTLSEGRITAGFPREEFSEESILKGVLPRE